MSLSVYNTALSDLRCGRILSSTYWTGAVEDIFISQISQWQKWVGRKWKRGWMSKTRNTKNSSLSSETLSVIGSAVMDTNLQRCREQSFITLPFLFGIFLSFDCFIYLHFPEGLFRKIHFAQLWLDKHQLVSYVLKVLVLHPSRWPLTLRISLSTPSRTHCTCEGLSCTAWNVIFKYLGKITRKLCQRHNS